MARLTKKTEEFTEKNNALSQQIQALILENQELRVGKNSPNPDVSVSSVTTLASGNPCNQASYSSLPTPGVILQYGMFGDLNKQIGNESSLNNRPKLVPQGIIPGTEILKANGDLEKGKLQLQKNSGHLSIKLNTTPEENTLSCPKEPEKFSTRECALM